MAWILPSDNSFLQVAHLASFLDVLLFIVYCCSSSEGQVTLGSGTFSGNASIICFHCGSVNFDWYIIGCSLSKLNKLWKIHIRW